MTTPAPNLVLSLTLDKDVYAPGETVTATAVLTQLDPFTVTASGTTADGTTAPNATATASVESVPSGTVSFGISDSLNGTWSQQSVNGNTGVFTETLPAAAG
jgi:hypothetical protein